MPRRFRCSGAAGGRHPAPACLLLRGGHQVLVALAVSQVGPQRVEAVGGAGGADDGVAARRGRAGQGTRREQGERQSGAKTGERSKETLPTRAGRGLPLLQGLVLLQYKPTPDTVTAALLFGE